jgi:hypothetical protein
MPMVSKNYFPELARASRGAESENSSSVITQICLTFGPNFGSVESSLSIV